jgi:hypothetical protein
MKKVFFLIALTFAFGLYLTEAKAQPPINVTKKTTKPVVKNVMPQPIKNTPAQNARVEQWILENFEPKEELQNLKVKHQNCISETDKKVSNTFVPAEETENYLIIRPCIKQSEIKTYQWIRAINSTLTAIRLEIGFNQNVISVWKKDTDPGALGQLPDYQIPVAKKVWDVQTLETDFAFIIFYKTLNDNGDVEVIEVDIP